MSDLAGCHECGKTYMASEMVPFRDVLICPQCKPVFFQKLKEGVAVTTALDYAGFWIRFVAKIIDSILVGIVYMSIAAVAGLFLGVFDAMGSEENPFLIIALTIGLQLLSLGMNAIYQTFFLGKYAATPGKMIAGLRVVRSDAAELTYWRAFGRFWSEMLTGFTMGIGYIIAAFDSERRALHDHIADTRVIHK